MSPFVSLVINGCIPVKILFILILQKNTEVDVYILMWVKNNVWLVCWRQTHNARSAFSFKYQYFTVSAGNAFINQCAVTGTSTAQTEATNAIVMTTLDLLLHFAVMAASCAFHLLLCATER